MKKTGIMGGTFNPIHIGHLIIAERAREQFNLDKVLFIPCGIPHLKEDNNILSKDARTKLTGLAIMDNPFFELSTIEVDKDGITYTYKTLAQLKTANADMEYYFIMGADSLWTIENWKEPEKVFANCHILAAVRNGRSLKEMETQAAYLKEKYGADISLLNYSGIEISSTMIRNMLASGESVRYLVPEQVYNYIIQHRLFLSN
ncbi:MAG: nicotinate-nucleotide adenylyltransferase [Butyrivibrio sp.]|nr:nicotinate-nucleotide adenylyltransferase [Butyrivibrio sp.]